MKRKDLIFTLFFVFAFANFSFGQNIAGSAHDFSGNAWSNNEICIVCHTPHNAITLTSNDAPLWNHELTGVATYTLYTSPTLNATTAQPGGASLLCLSCHDGTVALENFGGTTGGTNFVTGSALVGDGSDLSGDHPISFTYDDALAGADGGLYLPSTDPSGLGSTINADLLFGGQMQCASCHDVHNAANILFLLRMDNTNSALCLTCHNK